jgi:integrase
VRLTVYGKTEAEAVEKLRQAFAEIERGTFAYSGPVTVAKYLDWWLTHRAQGAVKPSTYRRYQSLLLRDAVPVIGRLKLSEITTLRLQHFFDQAQQKWAVRTVRQLRAVLHHAFSQAMAYGLLVKNPVEGTRLGRIPKYEVKPLTPKQAQTFARYLLTVPDGALYLVTMTLGLRSGEVRGLCWEDVDFEKNVVRIRHQLQPENGDYRLVELKTSGSRRVLSLPGIARDALMRQQQRQEALRAALGEKWYAGSLVFTREQGTPLSEFNVRYRVKKLLAEAGLPTQRFHDLRHLAASLLINQGVPAKEVSESLGHSGIGITLNTYGHLYEDAQERVSRSMDQALGEQL